MIAKMYRITFVFALISTLTACGTVSGWFKDDVYEVPATELTEFNHEFEPTIAWSTDTGGSDDIYSSLAPWIQGDNVIAVDSQGEVNSYDAQTGKRQWRVNLKVPVATGVGGGEGLILVGTKDGLILALDELNGNLLWKVKLSSEVLAPPKATQGVVVASTSDGRMTGLSKTDGHVLWNYQRAVPLLSLRGASAPVLADDKVIAGYANGKLVALSIIDGKVMWEKSIAVPRGRTELDRLVDIDADPVVVNNTVYVVAYHGRVVALSLDDGTFLWTHDMSSRSGLDVVVGDAVYVSDDEGNVWALQDGSGDSLWRQTRLLRRQLTAPVVVGDNLIVGDFEGYIHWISRQDGRFTARVKVASTAIRSKPVVSNDLVYVMAADGTLTAFRIK
ncbi:MAG: outer membrane protein assembly factor BamB [Pseudomonadota bacterium]|nr:outer membrane protein assembly factor BamB [Pseudomonadota bacterium]MDO7710308.1 outer membrane protein assembly factor BamB [Pseudomonadota bacterium]